MAYGICKNCCSCTVIMGLIAACTVLDLIGLIGLDTYCILTGVAFSLKAALPGAQ